MPPNPESPRQIESTAKIDAPAQKLQFLQEKLKLSNESVQFLKEKGTEDMINSIIQSYLKVVESEKPLADAKFKRFTENEQYSWYKKEKLVGEKAEERLSFCHSVSSSIRSAIAWSDGGPNHIESIKMENLNNIAKGAQEFAVDIVEANQETTELFTKINTVFPEGGPKFIKNTDIPQLTAGELSALLDPNSPKSMETQTALHWIKNNISRNNLLSTFWGMKMQNFNQADKEELSFTESGVKPEDWPFPVQQKEGVFTADLIMKYRKMDPEKAVLILNKLKAKMGTADQAEADKSIGNL